MARRIRVRGVPRSEPDVRLYVLALIELARQIQAEEQAAKTDATSQTPPAGSAEREADDD
jgi:hypothetical protein